MVEAAEPRRTVSAIKRARVRAHLLDLVEEGNAGEAIPAERVLSVQLGVSRPTLRSVVDDPGSGEIRWTKGNVQYDYVDQTALDAKLDVPTSAGITNVGVWSLGCGNTWFSTSSQASHREDRSRH